MGKPLFIRFIMRGFRIVYILICKSLNSVSILLCFMVEDNLTIHQRQYRENPDNRNYLRFRCERKKFTLKQLLDEKQKRIKRYESYMRWLNKLIRIKRAKNGKR
jgi:hypothetical protein